MVDIRDYREDDAESVGRLIADTFRAFNLSYASPEDQELLLGPFRHARSPDAAHRQAIAEVIQAPMVLVAQDGDPIAQHGSFLQVVRDQKHRLVQCTLHM